MPYHCAHCSSGFLQSALTIERAFSCCSELASVYVTKIHRSGAKKRWNLLQWFEAVAIKVPAASEGEITLYSLWSLGCSFFLDKTSSVRFHLFFFSFFKNTELLKAIFLRLWMLQRPSPGWELQGIVAPLVSAMWSGSQSAIGASVVQAHGPSLSMFSLESVMSQSFHRRAQWRSWWTASSRHPLLCVTLLSHVVFLFFTYSVLRIQYLSSLTYPREIAKSVKQLVLRRTSLWCSLRLCVYGWSHWGLID